MRDIAFWLAEQGPWVFVSVWLGIAYGIGFAAYYFLVPKSMRRGGDGERGVSGNTKGVWIPCGKGMVYLPGDDD
jgi:hypothetical protein